LSITLSIIYLFDVYVVAEQTDKTEILQKFLIIFRKFPERLTGERDEQLEACKRYEDDKILTKTMINNYAKNNLLPAPEKKKYSKEHVLTLLFIYYSFNNFSDSVLSKLKTSL